MKVITKASRIAEQAEEYRRNYIHDGQWVHFGNEEEYQAILNGTSKYVVVTCEECSMQAVALVELGEPDDHHESGTASVCQQCLIRALALLDPTAR